MIISDATSYRSNKKKVLLFVSAIVVLALLYLFYPRDYFNQRPATPGSFYCDMEVVENKQFVSSGQYFDGAKNQNSDYSRSGKHSCFLRKGAGNQYALGFTLPEFKAGDTFKASIWRFRKEGGDGGHLVVSAEKPEQLYKGSQTMIKTVGGWELLEVDFTIPFYKKVDNIKIYVFTDGNYPIYFDDLLIQKTGETQAIRTTAWAPQTMQIKLEDPAMRKLNKKREEALRKGILESADDDWVKTKITIPENNDSFKGELRLKGDWLDHLKSNKWSFRVKPKSGTTFNRLRYFSIHTPKARAYLHEWVLHELFKQEDILTTYYDFLRVELNGNEQGVYAIEEHFDKVLLERQKRREGPIVRFSEDGFWEGMKRHINQLQAIDHDIDLSIKTPQASTVTPFQEKKTTGTPLLKEQFEQASQLMEQYKIGAISASEIFDLDKMAKYFAICEALGGYHGITWHNQRFYFNPVIGKLEPIGYDGFAEKTLRKNHLLGTGALNTNKTDLESIEKFLFLDIAFTKKYAYYTQLYTSRSFLNRFFASIDEEFKAREAFIKTEFEDYNFDIDQLMVNAQRLHSMVLPFNDHSLKVHTQAQSGDTKTLKVGSYHNLPLELIGTGSDDQVMTDTFEQTILLESFYRRILKNQRLEDSTLLKLNYHNAKFAFDRQQPITYKTISVDKSKTHLFFKPLGIDSVFYTKIKDWPLEEGLSTRQAIFNDIKLTSNEIYNVSEGMIFFKKGKHQISKSIIIPEGYRVVFEAGCQLDFIRRAKFISKSSVTLNGSEDEPIIIRSSDKTAQGFTVLQAPEQSRLHYVEFDQFNTLKEKGWSLTGAVTFYESDVTIDHCVFKNNVCEDGLNIIRSEFLLEKSLVSNTFSDGFDADFCKGTVRKVSFIDTGNDGMDFSGSVIFITDAQVDNAGDKGVSVGEDTDASITNISVKNSNIAVAAKDLSTLFIENIDMEDCNQGFAAYQKKPEFGGAHIIVNKYTAKSIKRLHNIRVDCSLQLVDKITKGESLILSD